MARAKSTARAAARRTHRAELQARQAEEEPQDEAEDEVPRRQAARNESGTARPAGQVGLLQAVRLASGGRFRPVDDIQYLPQLVVRTNAVWPAALLVIGAGVLAFAGAANERNSLARMYLSFAVWPVAILPPSLAGFLSPRASWLSGLIIGLLQGLVAVAILLWNPSLLLDPGVTTTYAGALVLAVTYAVMFAVLAAWYKRFLALMTPRDGRGRGGRAQSGPTRRPSTGGRR